MEELHGNQESDTEQEFRRSIKRKAKIGIAMMLFILLAPITIYFLQYSVPSEMILLILVSFFSIGIIGTILTVYYGSGSSLLFYGIDILRKLAPPEPFIQGKFGVLNKDPVYGIAQWGSNGLFFIAFSHSERTFERKVKVPRLIWKWDYNHSVGDLKVARKKDTFTIPIDRDTFYTGEGVLYALLLEGTGPLRIRKTFTAKQLQQIVDDLAVEIGGFESSTQSGIDDF